MWKKSTTVCTLFLVVFVLIAYSGRVEFCKKFGWEYLIKLGVFKFSKIYEHTHKYFIYCIWGIQMKQLMRKIALKPSKMESQGNV